MVDRRTFLHHATALLGAALPARYIQTPRRYAIGLQLFTLNGAMNQDPVGTLTRVKAMGSPWRSTIAPRVAGST